MFNIINSGLAISSSGIIGFYLHSYKFVDCMKACSKATYEDSINLLCMQGMMKNLAELPGMYHPSLIEPMRKSLLYKIEVHKRKFSQEVDLLPIHEVFTEFFDKTITTAYCCMYSTEAGLMASHCIKLIANNYAYSEPAQKKLSGIAGALCSGLLTLCMTRSYLLGSAIAINYAYWHLFAPCKLPTVPPR